MELIPSFIEQPYKNLRIYSRILVCAVVVFFFVTSGFNFSSIQNNFLIIIFFVFCWIYFEIRYFCIVPKRISAFHSGINAEAVIKKIKTFQKKPVCVISINYRVDDKEVVVSSRFGDDIGLYYKVGDKISIRYCKKNRKIWIPVKAGYEK